MILASQSPRRRELLASCGVDFSIESAAVTELDSSGGVDVKKLPALNAELKADAVAALHPSEWVLGADTLVIFENRALGKPADEEDAFKMLEMLSGREHEVITGMALVRKDTAERFIWSESSLVCFKKLSDDDIREYMSKVDVSDKAGAYAIQEHGGSIIASCSGELENVIGLPLVKLKKLLAGPVANG